MVSDQSHLERERAEIAQEIEARIYLLKQGAHTPEAKAVVSELEKLRDWIRLRAYRHP